MPARSRQPPVQGAQAQCHVRLSEFTYVAPWTGFVYVAFVIDAYARSDLPLNFPPVAFRVSADVTPCGAG